MKVLITGGHPAPAFALIERLEDLKQVEFFLVGKKYALSGEKTLSFEYKQALKKGIKFYNLETGRFTRSLKRTWLLNFFKVIFGFFQSYKILRQENPEIIFSFGSYLAVPICVLGFFLRKNVFLHEQTMVPGLANRFCSLFAQKVFLAFEDSKQFFPKFIHKKIKVIGNPVRKAIFKIKSDPFHGEIKKGEEKVIYFTGGSLGSHSINQHVFKILPQLLKKYYVIHQVGGVKKYNDYENALKLRSSLKGAKEKYFPKEHFLDDEIGFVYKISDIVVSRSGANTFFEILALEKPVVFIPLPWSAGREQIKQAELFKKAGCGEVFNQNLSSRELLKLINKVEKNYSQYKKSFYKLKKIYKKDAAEIMVSEIFKAV